MPLSVGVSGCAPLHCWASPASARTQTAVGPLPPVVVEHAARGSGDPWGAANIWLWWLGVARVEFGGDQTHPDLLPRRFLAGEGAGLNFFFYDVCTAAVSVVFRVCPHRAGWPFRVAPNRFGPMRVEKRIIFPDAVEYGRPGTGLGSNFGLQVQVRLTQSRVSGGNERGRGGTRSRFGIGAGRRA